MSLEIFSTTLDAASSSVMPGKLGVRDRAGGEPASQSDRNQRRSSMAAETGQVTGTKDKHYNIIWFTEQSLSNALRLENYIEDVERDGDSELADFFRRAQEASRKGGEAAKALLKSRLGG